MVHSHENKHVMLLYFSNKTIKEKKTVWGRGVTSDKENVSGKKLKK